MGQLDSTRQDLLAGMPKGHRNSCRPAVVVNLGEHSMPQSALATEDLDHLTRGLLSDPASRQAV
jgi:hypothetical protein